jgi:hypothetical protein
LRIIHTISTFFLGILFQPLCKLPALKPDFKYLWFITCLYHDYGYCIENNKDDYPPQEYDLTAIIKKLNIKNDLLKTNHGSLFNPSTVENYYRYRQEELRIINH